MGGVQALRAVALFGFVAGNMFEVETGALAIKAVDSINAATTDFQLVADGVCRAFICFCLSSAGFAWVRMVVIPGAKLSRIPPPPC